MEYLGHLRNSVYTGPFWREECGEISLSITEIQFIASRLEFSILSYSAVLLKPLALNGRFVII